MESRDDNKIKNLPPEIDLINLAKQGWKRRIFILKVCGLSVLAALIIAFSIPKEYETTVLVIPESGSQSSIAASLGSLAALAGLNVGTASGSDAIYPSLYPKVVSTTPFLLDLFDIKVTDKEEKINMTLYDYLDEYQKQPWWGYIISAPFKAMGWIFSLFKDKEEEENDIVDPFNLTKDQAGIVKALDSRINVLVEKKTGVLSLSVRMQDPVISAAIADTVKNKLQDYITAYRTNKACQDLMFTEKLFEEAQEKYTEAQKAYATFTDGNLNLVSARYKAELERLENEMELSYNVYSQLAQQLQVAKAKVQEITPVYTVLQPAVVPIRAASPKKMFILAFFVFLGVVGSFVWIYFHS